MRDIQHHPEIPQDQSKRRSALVLLSGGIDSSACLRFYLNMGFDVRCLFVDYGQLSSDREWLASQKIASHYQIALNRFTCGDATRKSGGEIVGRNAFLLNVALLETGKGFDLIGIGIHAGTSYQDCAQPFIKGMQNIFDGYTGGQLRIGVPFLTWTKGDVWAYCKNEGVPVDLTYSCELGMDQPCGHCSSCADLETLYAG